MVNIPIKLGDTILVGRFKNKQIRVESIRFDKKGQLMINQKPMLKFRLNKRR